MEPVDQRFRLCVLHYSVAMQADASLHLINLLHAPMSVPRDTSMSTVIHVLYLVVFLMVW